MACLTGAALALRCLHLGRFEFWVDEAATWWFAHLVWGGGSLLQTAEPTPPVYYALIGLWMQWFGEADWLVRLPSALAGAATLPLVYDLGRRLFNRRVGWIAAILLAIHPLHIFYSREARVYTLLLLLTVALFIVLWRALEKETWKAWGLFAAVLFAICSLHVSGFFLGVTVGVQILLLAGSAAGRVRGLTAAALAGLALLPYVLWSLPQLEGSGAAWAVENMYRVLPEEGRLGRSLEMQLIGADYFVYLRQMDRPETPSVLRWWALLASLTLLILALLRSSKQRAGAFLAMAWLISILVPWTLSRTWQVFFHPGRHDFYTVGVVMVLLAVGFDRLLEVKAWPWKPAWRRPLLLFCLGGVVLGAAFRLLMLHAQPVDEPYRNKGRWLAQQASPDDRVITTGILRPVLQHYVRLQGNDVDMVSFPRSIDDHAGWSDDRALLEDMAALRQEAQIIAASAVQDEDGPPGRLFVALRSYRRVGDAVSVSWWVDRHLLEALRRQGWQRRAWPEADALDIAVFEPPGTAKWPGESAVPGALPEPPTALPHEDLP